MAVSEKQNDGLSGAGEGAGAGAGAGEGQSLAVSKQSKNARTSDSQDAQHDGIAGFNSSVRKAQFASFND